MEIYIAEVYKTIRSARVRYERIYPTYLKKIGKNLSG
jgi:hypothetical protein